MTHTPKTSLEIADILLEIGAVSLNPTEPFTWASGLKTPIYCDNRLIISYPAARQQVEQALADLIQSEFSDVDVIAGTATAGIPHAAIVAYLLNKPMIYVRSSAKAHGKQNAIEGQLKAGQKVVMIEDLISTGGSVIQAADMVTQAGGEVLGVCAIFNYLLAKGKVAFEETTYPLHTLTDYQILINQAVKNENLAAHRETLEQWYQDPQAWSQAFTQS
ncbi:orotate phosphoribosyltransferase [Fundicoccus sp. Sow4_D5]|uniref:orotate phosphoribosyltransferase n=1 Tax=unclassified Fundicoccus TaxID=2761543 RepID=UPI003F8FF3A5